MKRFVAVSVMALIALVPLAHAAPAARGGQKVSGTIVLPLPHPQAPAMCFQGGERRMNMATMGAATGLFGYTFDIDKKTWNKKFTVTPSGGAGAADLDIFFYLSFGPGIPDDPSMNAPSIIGEFTTEKAGGETGVVPKTATKAVVCMKGSVLTNFDYAAK